MVSGVHLPRSVTRIVLAVYIAACSTSLFSAQMRNEEEQCKVHQGVGISGGRPGGFSVG